jgi:hypothetical protein
LQSRIAIGGGWIDWENCWLENKKLFEKWFEKPILRARSARKMGFSNRF